ncbi:arsenic resistance N-acetyltransferase ArsN2 [Halorubellus salinus]|uniref:arsenic resistance N-acetyltransferase ArsN2 n=1 Tax=Halorubellus salinus TaxID=755309 RepID=UPI001D098460|nr:arsenic resistance N-acetyltransferase ArsN2 [Halorubellus salinus]
MSERAVDLERATGDRLADVEALLAANDLPVADVHDGTAEFYAAFDDGDAVGFGGLEVHDDAALLRSVVVRDAVRGRGYGTAICDALEREARERGVETVSLLTTTAASFFGARGYDDVDRRDAPAALRETAEFADLCPASATCMRKRLDGCIE